MVFMDFDISRLFLKLNSLQPSFNAFSFSPDNFTIASTWSLQLPSLSVTMMPKTPSTPVAFTVSEPNFNVSKYIFFY